MDEGAGKNRFFFEEFEVDSLKRMLLKNGESVALNSKTFDLLLILLENPGVILSKQHLLDLVWTNQFVEEKNLTVHVATLRKALGESRNDHRFIVTVPGNGYKFVAELKRPANGHVVALGPVDNDEIVEAEKSVFPFWVRSRVAVATAGAALLVALVVGGYLWQNRRKASSTATPAPQDISIKRLTSDGKVTNAALSPDGKLFAYSHFDGDDQSLWLGHLDGGEPVRIRPPAPIVYLDLKFSPDASSLFYTVTDTDRSEGTVYKIPVFGGLPEKIVDNAYCLTFSPNGKQFAFVRSDAADKKSALVVSDADGKNETELAVPPDMMNFVKRGFAWSPDGATIAIGVSRSDTNPDYGIFTVNTADGSVKSLSTAAWSGVEAMSWLPDGSGLDVVARKMDSAKSQIWYLSYPDGAVKRLVADLNRYGFITTISKDQNSFVTVQEETQSNIWIAPADGLAHAKQITFGSTGRMDGWFGLDWVANDKIVYTVEGPDNDSIWTMNADGSEQEPLIPSEGSDPSVTSDLSYVVFQSDRGGGYNIWRSDRDGSNLLKLTGTGIAAQPDVSPDGQWIVYVANPESSGELWRMTINGSEPVKLADSASWPRISPDGRLIACGYLVGQNTKLAVLSINGGNPIQLFDLPRLANLRYGVRWMSDGKSVTYRDWANGIWRQDISGGDPQRLKGLPSEKVYAYDWSPDGKFFAFTRGTETRDVVMISNFQ